MNNPAQSIPRSAIGALLLGAGFSRRFGSDKRFHTLPDGSLMSVATTRAYLAVFDHVRVVLRPDDSSLQTTLAALEGRIEFAYAADAQLGMGHSLAAGAAGLTCQFVFVGLLDMPFVKHAMLTTLADSATAGTIVQPRHNGAGGHPVGFDQCFYSALCNLHGDQGARPVLQANAGVIRSIAVDDPGVLADLDQPPGD